MKQIKKEIKDIDAVLAELAAIKEKDKVLSGQVKRLIRTESMLYEVQQTLDTQIDIYKKLYEAGKKMNATVQVDEIVQTCTEFVLYALNFERCIVLLRNENQRLFESANFDGFFDEEEKTEISSLKISEDHHVVQSLLKGNEGVIFQRSGSDKDLVRFGKQIYLAEYIVFPIGGDANNPMGLIIVGNGEANLDYSSRIEPESQFMLGLENLIGQATAALNNANYYKALEDERALLEKKVQQRTQELSQAVDELHRTNEDLRNAKEQAETANRFKSEFLARMSHEIRTPMNAIIGLTNLTLKTEINATQKDFLVKTYESSRHLLRIINDILDFSKIEAGKFGLAATDFMLHHVIDKMANMFRIKAAEKQIEIFYLIDKNVPLAVKGDPLRLGQVLINLISNAIKFTEKGYIIVRVTSNPEKAPVPPGPDQANLLFSVQDSGVGIAPDRQADLFEPFIQLDGSMTRTFEGTGLGLSICHRLVAMMGGRIWLKSALGRGSTFFFSLVLGLQPKPDRRTLTSPEDIGGLKVLVADDNPAARQILGEILTSFDMRVTTAASGEQALIELKRVASIKPYDLVVLDWKMQPMDGFDLARRIRRDPELGRSARAPRIIMATMYGQDEILQFQRSNAAGIDAFLLKPVSSSELFNSIMELFGKEEAMVPRTVFKHESEEIVGIEGITGARLLLVEDNVLNQQVAVAHLQRGGLIVDVAENGQAAVELVKTAWPPYDLVLMDIEMPVMDGYTATRIIREFEKQQASIPGQPQTGLPIIAMTAYALEGDREKCLAAGMNDYVPKPVEERELYAALIKWIKPQKRDVAASGGAGRQFAEDPWDSLPEHIAGIDLETALKRIHGNSGLYRRMLRNFLEEFEGAGDRIKEHLQTGRIKDACQLTHALRGVCTNIGAIALFRAVRDLDDGIRADKKEALPELLTAFLPEFTKLLAALRTLDLETESVAVPDETAPSVAPERIARIVYDMQALLAQCNSRALHSLPELKKALAGRQFADEMNLLDRTLYKLDFKKAAAILARISAALNIF